MRGPFSTPITPLPGSLFHADPQAKDIKATLRLQAAAGDKKIAAFLDRIMASDSPTVIKRYESEVETLERDKLVIAEKVAKCGTALPAYDSTFETAFEFISNPWSLWKNGTFEDKRIVAKLALDTPIVFDWNQGVRTTELSFPFRVLKAVGDQNGELAEEVSAILRSREVQGLLKNIAIADR